MGGHTKKVDTTPAQTQQVRSGVINYLNTPAGQTGNINAASVPGVQTAGPVSTMFNSGQDVNRSQVRDVSSNPTQSVDQLGGAHSDFFNNMVAQLQPSFDQARQQTAATAKESAGNLTGSGFANTLGSALNRTLGDQQAMLANYAAQGVNTEVGRQQGDANRAFQAQTANQGADQNFMNAVLQRNQQGLAAQQLGLQAQTQNQNTQQGANNLQYSTQAATANDNASRYLQLLSGQALAGVAPSTIQTSGGIGSVLGPIGGAIGTAMGGPIGGAIGNKILGRKP